MAKALEERFSYSTDPLSPQWCTSITHHSSKSISPLKENWMRPITNSPNYVFCVWHVNSVIRSPWASLLPCPPPTVTTPSLCSHPCRFSSHAHTKVALSSFFCPRAAPFAVWYPAKKKTDAIYNTFVGTELHLC